jgi:hypothetical protein
MHLIAAHARFYGSAGLFDINQLSPLPGEGRGGGKRRNSRGSVRAPMPAFPRQGKEQDAHQAATSRSAVISDGAPKRLGGPQ